MKRQGGIQIRPPQWFKGVGFGLSLIATLSVVGWMSLDKVLEILETQSQIEATIRLQQQVSQLRSHYQEANPDSLEYDFQAADQLLIQNFTHLAQWAQGLHEQGKRWDLKTQYRILNHDQSASSIEGVMLVPLEIQAFPNGTNSGYRPYLEFLKNLTQTGPRVDIQDVTILGNGQKATHLKMRLVVWMKTIDSVKL
jgi:hypothetical protein